MKRLFLLILTALVSFSLFAQSSTFDERYSNALRYYESHKYTRAIELLNSLIKVRGITPDQKREVIYLKEKCGNASRPRRCSSSTVIPSMRVFREARLDSK